MVEGGKGLLPPRLWRVLILIDLNWGLFLKLQARSASSKDGSVHKKSCTKPSARAALTPPPLPGKSDTAPPSPAGLRGERRRLARGAGCGLRGGEARAEVLEEAHVRAQVRDGHTHTR